MNRFYEELDKVREDGGRWKDSKRGDGTLKTVFIQTRSMRGFAEKYFRVVVVDATFGTNRYGLKLVPYVGIDALGKTQIMGIAFLPTENGAEIFEALDFFGLKKHGSTLITDDHSCYPKLAEEAKMNHLLCSYHFKEEILKACSVLPLNLRGRFAAELNAAMYDDKMFQDSTSIDSWFSTLREDAAEYPKMCSFLDRFNTKQKKVVAFWTRQFFSANSFASQRIEALNYAIKGKGERKNALARFNMYESYQRIMYTIANMEHQTKVDLQKLRTVQWAPFITTKWNENQEMWFSLQQQPGMQIEPDTTSSDVNVVFSFTGHTVTLRKNVTEASTCDSWPVCSCNEYMSGHIPCPFIVGACQKTYGSWKQLEYLHPHWHLMDHPWHEEQLHLQQLNSLTVHANTRQVQVIDDDAAHYDQIFDTCYNETVVPSQHWFGSELRQHIERIISVVKTEADYKMATASLTVLQHKLEHVGRTAAREPRVCNVSVKATRRSNVGTNVSVEQTEDSQRGKRRRPTDKKSSPSKKKKSASDDSRHKQKGSSSDAYIRAKVRENGGMQNGLVVEVEPEEIAKRQNERWYMTIVDGRLKKGNAGSNAALTSARYMKTNSSTLLDDDATLFDCKVDSILSVVLPAEMFQQSQIRQEKMQSGRLTYKVRFMNYGDCEDRWLDATVIDESLMKNWMRKRLRSARKMSEHEIMNYPYETYICTKTAMSATSKLKCTEGKYKGLLFQDIFDKDVSYCILMLELFAESGSKIKSKVVGGIGQFCRYLCV